jgi:superfamily II DNA or RNA helicase/HKD family nuclease
MTKVQLHTENLLTEIVSAIKGASSIYILTSFMMKSGIELLKPHLKEAAVHGTEIKICTGDYLFITHPEALSELVAIHPEIESRMWRSEGRSFHPKAYIFQNKNEGTLFIGSSNLSRAAFTTGIEWNISMNESVERQTFQDAIEHFTELLYNSQTIPINKETVKSYQIQYDEYHRRHPNLVKTWTQLEEKQLMLSVKDLPKEYIGIVQEENESYQAVTPRAAQKEAIMELEKTKDEGYNKAMVVMATGLGKTYLAAFFAKQFSRILFVAHREEILFQAQKSFKHVSPEKSSGLYYRKEKSKDTEIVFASIYTLGMKQHLEAFKKDNFDLIIIDEFHHAAANSYERLLEYFTPSFLLGITATPDRMDGKDVYGICDGNVAYQLHFIEAIQRQWLSPFHYFGIYDDTDYSQLTWLGTKYDQEELLHVQLKEEMAEKIFNAWMKHKQTKTLVFCSSIQQADFLSQFFNENGFITVSLHSRQVQIGRNQAIHLLETGKIDAIFTVDLFNEGVDIPSVDTLLFVRPTESLTVFTQQVGRGLRLYNGKDYCTIIDLIGNYRNADLKLSLFNTEKQSVKKRKAAIPIVPSGCEVDLDVDVVNLLEELSKKYQPRKERLYFEYKRLKEELGRRPTYLEIHLYANGNAREYKQEFNSFAGFLYWANELSEKEQQVYKDYHMWLEEVERTSMSKSYKMVVLKYMLSRDIHHSFSPITAEETAPFFKQFFQEKKYRMITEFGSEKTKGAWLEKENQLIDRIKKMPMTKWSGSSNGLIEFKDDTFRLAFDVAKEDVEVLHTFTKEICDYRLHEYFERKGRK